MTDRAPLITAAANVLDFWDRVPNDIRSDPGLESLYTALMKLEQAISDLVVETEEVEGDTQLAEITEMGGPEQYITVPCAPRHTCIIQPNPMPHDMGGST